MASAGAKLVGRNRSASRNAYKQALAILLLLVLASRHFDLEFNYKKKETIAAIPGKTAELEGAGTALLSGRSAALERRTKMYRDRYRYRPAKPYHNHTARGTFCGNAPSFSDYFKKGDLERSANQEDKTVYELFFKDDVNGTAHPRGSMVELGAFNGVRESNSRFFDLCLGWDTLLIEGNPRQYDQLLVNRPQAHLFNYVPCCTKEEELANKTIKFDAVPWTNGGISDGSVKTAYSEQNETKKVDVPCGSLTKVLLDVFPNGRVSFFSLDVEGSEPMVIGKLDFGRVYIEIMMIENWNNYCPKEHCASRDEYRKIMIEAGYIMFDKMVTKSDIFIHPLSKHLEMARKKGYIPPRPKNVTSHVRIGTS